MAEPTFEKVEEIAERWIKIVRDGGLTYEEAIDQSTQGMSQGSPIAGIIRCKLRIAQIESPNHD